MREERAGRRRRRGKKNRDAHAQQGHAQHGAVEHTAVHQRRRINSEGVVEQRKLESKERKKPFVREREKARDEKGKEKN